MEQEEEEGRKEGGNDYSKIVLNHLYFDFNWVKEKREDGGARENRRGQKTKKERKKKERNKDRKRKGGNIRTEVQEIH